MIISHRHKFIFLRTEKTGGTSVQVALAQLCGPEDMISSGEHRRNFTTGLGRFLPLPDGARHYFPTLAGFHIHTKAREVRAMVDPDIWKSYYKFAIERNPWDRQVSQYFHRQSKRDRKASFDAYISSPIRRHLHHVKLDNWGVYAIGDTIVADEVIPYEELTPRLAELGKRLSLTVDISQVRRNADHRPKRPSYRELYSEKTREIVRHWYSREIKAFGYEF